MNFLRFSQQLRVVKTGLGYERIKELGFLILAMHSRLNDPFPFDKIQANPESTFNR